MSPGFTFDTIIPVSLSFDRIKPSKIIMQISGHKTESQCLRYIKAGYNELEQKIGELDFWNKK